MQFLNSTPTRGSNYTYQDNLGFVDIMLQEAADEWMKENRRKASQQKIQTVYLVFGRIVLHAGERKQ